MRRMLLFVGGWVLLQSAVSAQFATDRKPPVPAPPPPTTQALPPGAGITDLLPYNPAAKAAPAAGPARPGLPPSATAAPPPQAPRTAHPLAVTPQHGEWLICVKSYTGPESLAFCERLAADIRKHHAEMPVYLFEHSGEERAKLAAEQAQARQRVYEQSLPFIQMREELKKKAEAEGRVFVDDGPVKVRVPTLLTQVPEQWAVLIGGYKTQELARKALDAVHKWGPPSDPALMDKVTDMQAKPPRDGEQVKLVVDNVIEVNPYPKAMCVRNPSLPKSKAEAPADPALWKWNEGEPLSVLNCEKPYTLIVKSFTMPVVASGKDQEPSVMQTGAQSKPGQPNNAQLLAINAASARNLALMLRGLKDQDGRPVGFDTYVLHMKTGSIVCVGQYDKMDDPAMAAVVTRLTNLRLNLTADASGRQAVVPGERSMFDQVSVLKIPRR